VNNFPPEYDDTGWPTRSEDPASVAESDPMSPLEPEVTANEPAAPVETDDPPDAVELADWKTGVREAVEQWLATVDCLPDECESDADLADAPDLHSLLEQLTVVASESRRVNRRTIDALGQWTALLQGFDTGLADVRAAVLAREEQIELSREYALALVDLLDRLNRIGTAFARRPARAWGWGLGAWRKAWATQGEALDIVREHLVTLLTRAGIEPIRSLGAAFDPLAMTAVAAEPDPTRPHQTVIEELSPGYRWGGDVLRTAQVKVSVNRKQEAA
jgi:hypothetical protein